MKIYTLGMSFLRTPMSSLIIPLCFIALFGSNQLYADGCQPTQDTCTDTTCNNFCIAAPHHHGGRCQSDTSCCCDDTYSKDLRTSKENKSSKQLTTSVKKSKRLAQPARSIQ